MLFSLEGDPQQLACRNGKIQKNQAGPLQAGSDLVGDLGLSTKNSIGCTFMLAFASLLARLSFSATASAPAFHEWALTTHKKPDTVSASR